MMERAISMSVYGDKPRYCAGVVRNCIIAPHVFEDWQVVLHYDDSVPSPVIEECKKYGAICENCTSWGMPGVFWRFCVNDIARRWICRDADGRLSVRDLAAVEAWIASGKKWHVVRDDPAALPTPILAGLWGGFETGVKMRDLIQAWPFSIAYGDDQKFLAERVWPMLNGNAMVHSIVGDNPVPRARVGHYYLGQVWDEGERRW